VAASVTPVAASSSTHAALCDGRMRFQSSRDIESASAVREAQRLLASIPDAMLMHGRHDVPAAVRRANLISTISQYDAGTVSKGRTAVQKWLDFCKRHYTWPSMALRLGQTCVCGFCAKKMSEPAGRPPQHTQPLVLADQYGTLAPARCVGLQLWAASRSQHTTCIKSVGVRHRMLRKSPG